MSDIRDQKMKGRRLYVRDVNGDGDRRFYETALCNTPYIAPQAGDYWQASNGDWCAKVPTGARCGLRNHQVTEHEDGTITASPSILLTMPGMEEMNWHGYLERGVWRSC